MIDVRFGLGRAAVYVFEQFADRDAIGRNELAHCAAQQGVRLDHPVSGDERKHAGKWTAQQFLFREDMQRPPRFQCMEPRDAQLSVNDFVGEFSCRLDFDQAARVILHGYEEVRYDVADAITIDGARSGPSVEQSNAKAAVRFTPRVPDLQGLFPNADYLRASCDHQRSGAFQLSLTAQCPTDSGTRDQNERSRRSPAQPERRWVR